MRKLFLIILIMVLSSSCSRIYSQYYYSPQSNVDTKEYKIKSDGKIHCPRGDYDKLYLSTVKESCSFSVGELKFEINSGVKNRLISWGPFFFPIIPCYPFSKSPENLLLISIKISADEKYNDLINSMILKNGNIVIQPYKWLEKDAVLNQTVCYLTFFLSDTNPIFFDLNIDQTIAEQYNFPKSKIKLQKISGKAFYLYDYNIDGI